MAIISIEVRGEGTRKTLANALRALANSLHSDDDIDELYNIDGALYYDGALEVIDIKDTEL